MRLSSPSTSSFCVDFLSHASNKSLNTSNFCMREFKYDILWFVGISCPLLTKTCFECNNSIHAQHLKVLVSAQPTLCLWTWNDSDLLVFRNDFSSTVWKRHPNLLTSYMRLFIDWEGTLKMLVVDLEALNPLAWPNNILRRNVLASWKATCY